MATRQRNRPSSGFEKTRRGREIMRPIISSDVMGNRNVEIVPVGAWVEPADADVQQDAVTAAKEEELKIKQIKEEKENCLRDFQRKVKQRLNYANRLKREKQIQEAEEAFERERKVVQQSLLTGDAPRRDTCIQRQDLDKAIMKRLLEKYGDVSTWERVSSQPLQSHTEESHQVTDKARQQLISRKIGQKSNEDSQKHNLRSKATRVVQNPVVRSVVNVDGGNVRTSQSKRKTQKLEEDKKLNSELEVAGNKKNDQVPNSRTEAEESDNTDVSSDYDSDYDSVDEESTKVQFADPKIITVRQKIKKRSGSSKRPSSSRLYAILSQDAENGLLARQRKQQTAVSRRIFMDREREAVRENIRRQEHRKKIISLKKEKEEVRQELEELAHQQFEPDDFEKGESAEEAKLREEIEQLQIQEMVNRKKDEIRKAREMERYLDALRHSLVEKVSRQRLQLPALCSCGDTIWDTHPETCANNCFFYKNHRAYARALQSLLTSSEVK
ncbi:coiled-coil domain-containing protein 15-like isoform X2 [Physella acuta]|uniref:coiled-coil domain-containing protein 15-like isoform X2 n=1 Tax=Physella acuta TaxID=109671 RepID=UPI0027DDDFBE|nr:coiled-coil domain-containing protein 15-like isoform X2 [Physella acuta]